MALIETHIFSEALGMDMTVTVIYPQEKQPYSGDGKLKVVWLLHGGSGDHTAWQRMSSIEKYALDYGVAVVIPGGLNSCFTDMEHGGAFFTYVSDELPAVLQGLFPRLSDRREDNYISGFSNGGFGCLRVGLARPERYAAIGAFSAGCKSDVAFVNDGSRRALDRIILFGDGDMKGTDNDVKHLGRLALESRAALPKVYHACGSLDPWLDLNELVRDFFVSQKGNPFHYEFHLAEGYGHTWPFWDMEIVRFFEYLGLPKDETRYIGI
ncbi:alpha/beta hydrolase [Paenibacillus turpanensis]|uniref:alpha/beta hydrolase n=1 Tax=Paenibacillus turpanensis TaxID=2689078 RepID=UPI00140B69AD|nr:alpha/beta hydrolase-fold protein [Paenibacillus turpanensis]